MQFSGIYQTRIASAIFANHSKGVVTKWLKWNTVKPLILVTLNFGIWVNLIILDPVILAFLLPTTLKRYCIQLFAARYFR